MRTMLLLLGLTFLAPACSRHEDKRVGEMPALPQPAPAPVPPPPPSAPAGPTAEELRLIDIAKSAVCSDSWQAWRVSHAAASPFAAMNKARDLQYTEEILRQVLSDATVRQMPEGITSYLSYSVNEVNGLTNLDFNPNPATPYLIHNDKSQQEIANEMRQLAMKSAEGTLTLFYVSDAAAIQYAVDVESKSLPVNFASEAMSLRHVYGSPGYYDFQTDMNELPKPRIGQQETLLWFAQPLAKLFNVKAAWQGGERTPAALLNMTASADPMTPLVLAYPMPSVMEFGGSNNVSRPRQFFGPDTSDLVDGLPTADCLKRIGYSKVTFAAAGLSKVQTLDATKITNVFDFSKTGAASIRQFLEIDMTHQGALRLFGGTVQPRPDRLALLNKIKEYASQGIEVSWYGLGIDDH